MINCLTNSIINCLTNIITITLTITYNLPFHIFVLTCLSVKSPKNPLLLHIQLFRIFINTWSYRIVVNTNIPAVNFANNVIITINLTINIDIAIRLFIHSFKSLNKPIKQFQYLYIYSKFKRTFLLPILQPDVNLLLSQQYLHRLNIIFLTSIVQRSIAIQIHHIQIRLLLHQILQYPVSLINHRQYSRSLPFRRPNIYIHILLYQILYHLYIVDNHWIMQITITKMVQIVHITYQIIAYYASYLLHLVPFNDLQKYLILVLPFYLFLQLLTLFYHFLHFIIIAFLTDQIINHLLILLVTKFLLKLTFLYKLVTLCFVPRFCQTSPSLSLLFLTIIRLVFL